MHTGSCNPLICRGWLLPLLALTLVLILTGTAAADGCTEGGYCPERTLTFTRNDIASLHGAAGAKAADIDGDGDLDVVAAGYEADNFVWYENTGTDWSTTVIASRIDHAHGVDTADFDGDGDLDVLAIAATGGGLIRWYANPGTGSWSATTITTSFTQVNAIQTVDMDDDGDPDVLATCGNGDQIAWYRNDDKGTSWTQVIIARVVDRPFSPSAVDMDGDGDLDVLVAITNEDEVAWFENADGAATLWTRHVIDPASDGAHDVHATDMDGDGDLDLVAVAKYGSEVAWYERGTPFGSALEFDGSDDHIVLSNPSGFDFGTADFSM